MDKTVLSLHQSDDVAVALAEIAPGLICTVRRPDGDSHLAAKDLVAFGHKIALHDIASGEPVHKYGEVIGTAQNDIRAGEHVHIHNLS